MYSANANSEVNGGLTSSVINLPPFPSEDPSKRELDAWIDHVRAGLTRAGFGAAMRGEDPLHLLSLKQQSVMNDIAKLTAAQKSALSPLESAKHQQMVEETALKKSSAKLAYEAGLREYHNKLAATLDAAMRKSAGLRLRVLLEDHKDKNHDDTYDGGAMWRELVKLSTTASRLDDARQHDRAFETARDVFLPDGCSAKAFMDKINVLSRDHLPWMERKIEGAELGRCIIGMMPKCNGSEGRQLIRELSKADAEPGLNDVPYVIGRCADIVRESATGTDDMHSDLQAHFASADARAMVLDYCRSRGANAASLQKIGHMLQNGSGKAKTGKPKGKEGDKKSSSRLPEGQLCKAGTCNFRHDEISPGQGCFRDPRFNKPLPERYCSSPDQVRRIEEARKANAKKLGVPYKPLQLPKNTASPFVPIADA